MAEDPGARVLPYCLSGGTDNKAFSRLGITGYGFAPLRLPPDLDSAIVDAVRQALDPNADVRTEGRHATGVGQGHRPAQHRQSVRGSRCIRSEEISMAKMR